MKRIIVLGILIIICFVLQTSLLPLIEIANINPNLLLILTVSFGLMRGRMEGMFVGFSAVFYMISTSVLLSGLICSSIC